MKKIKKSLWITLTSVFAALTIGSFVGGALTSRFTKTINDYFGLPSFDVIEKETNEEEDLEYFKSKYTLKDGSLNDVGLHKRNVEVANQVQREGTTLLWNSNDNGLPLSNGNKVSLFSRSSADLVISGYGSGKSSGAYTNLKNALATEGINVNETLWNFYSSGDGSSYTRDGKNDKVNEVPWDLVNKNCSSSFNSYNDAAIMVISRQKGESDDWGDASQTTADTLTGDYYQLHKNEKATIENLVKLKKDGVFKRVIVLLNTPTGINFDILNEYKSDIDSCVWVGQPGKQGSAEIAKIIAGKSIPSGHLVDTFLYDNQSAPANVNSDFNDSNLEYAMYTNFNSMQGTRNKRYQAYYAVYAEGIYVGYKYYETRYEDSVLNQGNATSSAGVVNGNAGWKYSDEVAFPFGYGGSYTKFEYSDYEVNKNKDGDYEISLTVTNVGDKKGADAVQVYVQKPYTDHDKQYGLEQSSVNLAGYAKTKELDINESQIVNITVRQDAFKTYDHVHYKTYIYEPGDYYISIGQDSHDAVNNILSHKGKTMSDGMDAPGNRDLVYKFENSKLDTETFSKSSTGYDITNQLSDGDWNLYENKTETNITYLSRSDWQKTYPQHVKLSLNDKMVYDLSWDKPVEEKPGDKMPLYGQSRQFNLIDLRGLPYDHDSWEILLNQMTLEEQSELMASAYHGTKAVTSINKPADVVNDGPLGIRMNYKTNSSESTMNFPIIPILAATFNDDLVYEVGQLQGEDCLHSGCNGMYSPGANLHRSIYGGRTYEYYSEDPFISGMMCMYQTKGIQESGTYVTLKHFALNEAEDKRFGIGTWANEQTIRETYLPAFQYAVEEADAKSVMSAYNRIGTLWSGAHRGLQTEILRNEWGFEGFVISDCAWRDFMGVVDGLMAGNDCILYEMKDKQCYTKQAKGNATICLAMREAVHRILYVTVNSNTMNGISSNTTIVDVTNWWQHAIVALEIVMTICFVGSAIMLTLSFIPDEVFKKKPLSELTEEEKEIRKKKKKRNLIIGGSILGVVIVSQAILIPVISYLNRHICENVCEICQKCTDSNCQEDICLEKCEGHLPHEYIPEGAKKYRFEAEAAILTGSNKNAKIGTETNANNPSGGNYVMNVDYEGDVRLTYNITSDKDAYAAVYATIGRNDKVYNWNEMFTIYLNGEEIKVDDGLTIEKMATGGMKWFDWVEKEICLFNLKQGNNVIEFYNNSRRCLNFDAFDLLTVASLSWTTEIDGTHLDGKWSVAKEPTLSEEGQLIATCYQCENDFTYTLPVISEENGYKKIDDITYSYTYGGQTFEFIAAEISFDHLGLEVIDDKVYYIFTGVSKGYKEEDIIVTNSNKTKLGNSQYTKIVGDRYKVYIDVTNKPISDDPYIFVRGEGYNGTGKISFGRVDNTKRPYDALYFNNKKYTIEMYRAIPHVLVEDAASSVSFISTDTARFEVVDDRLYYVFNGTAYNVDVNTISFDFMAKSGNVNLLNGKVEAKKINDYGYNYTYEVWSDISDMNAGTGRMYPHVLYNNGLSQDAIDFHWASKGTAIDYKGKHYYMDSEYNMPVLEITAA